MTYKRKRGMVDPPGLWRKKGGAQLTTRRKDAAKMNENDPGSRKNYKKAQPDQIPLLLKMSRGLVLLRMLLNCHWRQVYTFSTPQNCCITERSVRWE